MTRGEAEPYRAFLSHELYCAVMDSVLHAPPIDDKIKNPNTRKSRAFQKENIDHNREQARAWIRDGYMGVDETTGGFGYVWEMLRFLGSVKWDLELFVEEMEKLWEAVDKDPAQAKKITTIMRAISAERGMEKSRIDKAAEIAKIKETIE